MRDVALSLAGFVNELALAWQKLALYQEGHPARQEAVAKAHGMLVRLIAPTGGLAIGVGRDALIGPEEKLVSGGAPRLADALYRREVAVLRFAEGVESGELARLLTLLPRSRSDKGERPLAEDLAGAGVRHIAVETVDFSGLVATDALDDTATRQARESLWDRILQRLLKSQSLAAIEAQPIQLAGGSLQGVVELVEDLLGRYAPGSATDEAVAVGTLDELRTAIASAVGGAVGDHMVHTAGTAGDISAGRHVAELLVALPEVVREGVFDAAVRELATREEGAEGLQSLSASLSAAELVGALRRLRREKVVFARRSLSLVEQLAVEAAGSSPALPGDRPEAFEHDLRELFGDFDVDRAAPGGAYGDRFFLELRRADPVHARFADLDPYLDTLGQHRLAVQLSATLIDLMGRPLGLRHVTAVITREQATFREILASGRFSTATSIVESLRGLAEGSGDNAALRVTADQCLEVLRDGQTLAAMIDTLPDVRAAAPALRRLLDLLGPEAVREMVMLLGEEADLSRRRRIFDLLAELGPVVVPAALQLLDDPRWYMTRNILSLLRRLGEGIDEPVVRRGLEHSDARVRLEAIKCIPDLAAQGHELAADVVARLLSDAEPRVAEAAVVAFAGARLRSAIAPLLELLSHRDPLGRQRPLRVKALQALATIGDPAVLPQLAPYFRVWFAVVGAEESQVAFASLAQYPEAARRPWVRKGRRALDPRVRAICRRIEESPAGATAPEGAR